MYNIKYDLNGHYKCNSYISQSFHCQTLELFEVLWDIHIAWGETK